MNPFGKILTVLSLPLGLFLAAEWALRERIFSILFGLIAKHVLKPLLVAPKRELFSTLEDNKKPGAPEVRILEIGFGGGSNLDYYPASTRLICVEPNAGFQAAFHADIKWKCDRLSGVEFIRGRAEKMDFVPDGSVDVVVSTYCLCSVSSPREALGEIRRVLRPGGKFYYMEHVTFDGRRWPLMRTLQRLVAPLWVYISCGCHFRPPTHHIIEQEENFFSLDWYKQRTDILSGPAVPLFLWPTMPHEYGVATKQ